MSDKPAGAALKLQTSRFGLVEIPPEQVLTLPLGMVGFPHLTRYAILAHRPGSPFHWLQSLERPDLAFVIMDPRGVDPNYELTLGDNDVRHLQISAPQELQIWVVVTIPPGAPAEMTANFKAPLAINLAKRLGMQIILEDPRWLLRQKLKK